MSTTETTPPGSPAARPSIDLMSMTEAAHYLGMSVRTLERIKAAGEIAHVRFGAGKRPRVGFRQEHLDDWLARAEQPVTAPVRRRTA